MKTIPLHGKYGTGRFAIVDDVDYGQLAEHRWLSTAKGYVRRYEPARGRPGRLIQMHRVVLGLASGDGLFADHINGDTYDNRRSNLRAVTPGQNMQNRPHPRGASAYRGVCFVPKTGRWKATVRAYGVKHNAGSFATELEAAEAARALRLRLLPFTVEASS